MNLNDYFSALRSTRTAGIDAAQGVGWGLAI